MVEYEAYLVEQLKRQLANAVTKSFPFPVYGKKGSRARFLESADEGNINP